MRRRTWKILQWTHRPELTRTVELRCACGRWAHCEATEVDALIIAVIGMGVVFDPPNYHPPENFLPDIIKCRKCGREYNNQTS